MQIGQTIWAIDPCEMTFTKKEALKVGKAYEVKKIDNECFVIESELTNTHVFYLLEFDTFFSLTPPEGKGGYKAFLELTVGNALLQVSAVKRDDIIATLSIHNDFGISCLKLIKTQVTQLRDHLTEVLNKE